MNECVIDVFIKVLVIYLALFASFLIVPLRAFLAACAATLWRDGASPRAWSSFA
mgnify:CR=1 FL=1